MNKFSLTGKVALITGSTQGLGLGVAKALGSAGAKIAINYLNNRIGWLIPTVKMYKGAIKSSEDLINLIDTELQKRDNN